MAEDNSSGSSFKICPSSSMSEASFKEKTRLRSQILFSIFHRTTNAG